MKLSIIVPVYNEEESLVFLHKRISEEIIKLTDSYEIIYINDGFIDNSGLIIDEIIDTDQNVKQIVFKRNFGQTAAIMAGIDHAQGEIIIPLDADLQNDPADIVHLLKKLDEGHDVVSGWRKDRKDSKSRILPSVIANKIISRVSGVHLHDYGCTLKVYRANVVKDIKLYGEMHRFIPIYAYWQGAKVTEIPVKHHPREHGVSKYGMERIFKVILDLIVIVFLFKYAKKPIYVFGGFGLASMALSLVSVIYAVYLKIFEDISFILTPLPLLAVFAFLTGFIAFLMGFLAELIMRTYYESQNKSIYIIKSVRSQS